MKVLTFFSILLISTTFLTAQEDNQIDVELYMHLNTALFVVGDTINYVVDVFNWGPDAATEVEATIYFTQGKEFISFIPSVGTYDEESGVWNIGTLNAGVSALLSVEAIIGYDFQLTDFAQITNAVGNDVDSTPNNSSFYEDDEDGVLIYDYIFLYPCEEYHLFSEVICNDNDTYNVILTTNLWAPFSTYTVVDNVSGFTYNYDYLNNSFGPYPIDMPYNFTVYFPFYDECEIHAVNNKVYCGAPLSVELTTFEIAIHHNYVVIDWETASEYDNEFFVISRSNDGQQFTEITKIEGAGTKNTLSKYQYIDYISSKGSTIYYKLQSVDVNNQIESFEIKSVNVSSNLNVSATLTGNNIEILGVSQTQDFKAELFSSNGLLIKQVSHLAANSVIEIANLPVGMYLLLVSSSSNVVLTKKLAVVK